MKLKKIKTKIFAQLILLIFMASIVNASQSAVNLGSASNYVILAKSGISTTGTTSIVGNIGVSPIDGTGITGFGLILDSSNQFATSSLVNGKIYAADYAPTTPAMMTTAISDMETAYTDAAGRTNPTATELGAGDISAMTIVPGLYKWSTGVIINNAVTLDCQGNANGVFIFQIAQTLTVGSGAIVTLAGGCRAENIVWQITGQTTLGTTSVFEGTILDATAIVMNTGASLNGRALAQTAVTLDSNQISSSSRTTQSQTKENTISNDNSNEGSSANNDGVYKSNNQEQSSNNNEKTLTIQNNLVRNDQTEKASNSVNNDNNNNNQGIGQELSQQIRERKEDRERKEEIKSGDYEGSLGKLLNVRELAQNIKELRVNDVIAQTDLNITADIDSQGKTKLKTKLNNGFEREIMIMPDTASEKALEKLKVKVCSIDNKCTIQLNDVGIGITEKIQYELQLEKQSKILGLFAKKMQVSADVNAQTGDIVVHKPWWAFMATEQQHNP